MPLRLDAERDERRFDAERAVAGHPVGCRDRTPRNAALRLDPGVGREDEHDLARVAVELERGEGDGRGRVPPSGSGITRTPGAAADHRPVAALVTPRDVLGLSQLGAHDPIDGPLEQRPSPSSGRNGLGARPAQRPQSGAAAPGHDHGVHRGILRRASRGAGLHECRPRGASEARRRDAEEHARGPHPVPVAVRDPRRVGHRVALPGGSAPRRPTGRARPRARSRPPRPSRGCRPRRRCRRRARSST